MDFSLGTTQSVLFDVSNLLYDLSQEMGLQDVGKINKEMFADAKKENVVEWMLESVQSLKRCHDALKASSQKIDSLKDSVISLQETKIQSQAQLLTMKNETVESFQSTLKTEMRSYCDVVTSGSISPKCIQDVVRDAVKSEDRSKNVILYGVKEDHNDDQLATEKTVSDIFTSIGEKPHIRNCSRVGKTGDKTPLPIKVCLNSSEALVQVWQSARKLKDSAVTKSIYVAPDRSREERQERKKLVDLMKIKIKSDPVNYYFISGNDVCSRKRVAMTNSSSPPTSQSEGTAPVKLENAFDAALRRARETQSKLIAARGEKK